MRRERYHPGRKSVRVLISPGFLPFFKWLLDIQFFLYDPPFSRATREEPYWCACVSRRVLRIFAKVGCQRGREELRNFLFSQLF